MMGASGFIGTTTLLYAVANPVGVIPIFLGFTHRLKNTNPLRIILAASVAVGGFLVFSVLLGKQILSFFNVGLDDFRIAGGLLALFVAFEMFQARYGGIMQTLEEKTEAEEDLHHHIAITPLAFPLLVGPAEMSIIITLSNDMPDLWDKTLLVISSLLTALLIAVTLWAAVPINRIIGKTGVNIATRILALVVASIGIKFIMIGLRHELPGLVR